LFRKNDQQPASRNECHWFSPVASFRLFLSQTEETMAAGKPLEIMSQIEVPHHKRDRAASLTASLILHCIVFSGLWCYLTNIPKVEPVTVFLSSMTFAEPDTIAVPVAQNAPRLAPVKKAVTPATALADRKPLTLAAKVSSTAAVVSSPAAPVSSPAPAAKSPEAPISSSAAPVLPSPRVVRATAGPSSPAVSQPVNQATYLPAGASTQPVLLAAELSVHCSERPAPTYPRIAQRLGEQGQTVLHVELDELGKVAKVNVQTTSGFPRLDEAAVSAVKSWHCSPAKRNGQAVRSVASQPFTFNLKGR
jgi:periplasmic protein TonB